MRTSAALLVMLLSVPSCGGGGEPSDAGGSDAPGRDAPAGGDVPMGAIDAPGTDVPLADAPATPEVCTGGVDEDADGTTDCADRDCWADDLCIDADVAAVVPGLVRCGDPIVLDAAATAEACGRIGTPDMSMIPTECSAGTVTVRALVYCDGAAAAALWIEEQLVTPRTNVMVTPRRFDATRYDRQMILDWERHASGPGARTGMGPIPAHDGEDLGSGDASRVRVITVRAVLPGDRISRLLGLSFISTVIDLDSGMATDTRRTLRTGGLEITVP